MLEYLVSVDSEHRITAHLPVVLNMPFMVEHNVAVASGNAKGTRC